MDGLAQEIYLRSPVAIQNLLLSTFAWQRRKTRLGPLFQEATTQLATTERSSSEARRQYQERLLVRLMRHCWEAVPFYRERMEQLGLTPADCNTLEGLRRLPILTRADVQTHADRLQSTVPWGPVEYVQTSGTTGSSLKLVMSYEALSYEWAVVWRHRGRAGIKPGDRLASFGGRTIMRTEQNQPPYWRLNRVDSQIIFSNWHVSDRTLPDYIQAYSAYKADFVQGYPSFLYQVAEFAQRSGMKLRPPRVIFTSSETLHAWQRITIEAAFGAPILDYYGSGEKIASIFQCEAGGYHVDAGLGIVEVVDGQIVATGLHNLAMPLVRYNLGDAAEWSTDSCSCGCTLPLMCQPMGRVDDLVVSPEGRKFGRLDHLFKDTRSIREAQLIQVDLDKLTVLVVPSGLGPVKPEQINEVISSALGKDIHVNVQIVDQIPRTKSGKFRFVVSHLHNNRTQ